MVHRVISTPIIYLLWGVVVVVVIVVMVHISSLVSGTLWRFVVSRDTRCRMWVRRIRLAWMWMGAVRMVIAVTMSCIISTMVVCPRHSMRGRVAVPVSTSLSRQNV